MKSHYELILDKTTDFKIIFSVDGAHESIQVEVGSNIEQFLIYWMFYDQLSTHSLLT